MPVYERAVDRGARRGRCLVTRTTTELAIARRAAGLSQRELGRRLRISHNTIGRIERGGHVPLTFELAASMAAVLGLQLNVTLHVNGAPVRDAGHLALLARFQARLGPTLRWRTEVPLPIQGDRRSADAVVDGNGFRAMVEAETRIDDVQALERRLNLKQRDMAIGRAILLVAETRHNRAVVAKVPAIRVRFPVSTRACLAALTQGRDPGGDALVFL